jgi:type IV pilus assembly protein PilP
LSRRVILVAALLFAGCGGDDEKKPINIPPPAARPGAPPAGAKSAVAPLQPGVEQSKESLLAEVRKRQLSSDDFKESPSNRDPFRSFLSTFATQVVNVKPQHRIVAEKFALEELKLIAIVTGSDMQARAMFTDPTGAGVTLVRGDHVSKSDALVERVAPDRVFFQLEEDLGGGGKPKLVERVVELHAGENIAQ